MEAGCRASGRLGARARAHAGALLLALVACAPGALLAPSGAAAGPATEPPERPFALEPHERLVALARAEAARHAGQDPAVLEVRPPDPRLRLPACPVAPAAAVAPGTRSPGQLTVELRCSAPAWRQYLAVRIRAEVDVVIAARPLPAARTLGPDDLALVRRELATLHGGHFASVEDVLGRVLQRPLGAGEVLRPALARQPPLVRRGQEVTVLAQAGGLTVRSRGVALADAGLEERVRVRNLASGRQLEGVVRSADSVEVDCREAAAAAAHLRGGRGEDPARLHIFA